MTLYQIWTDDYVYAVTNSGCYIYDIGSELEYAYVTYSGGFSTVWANDNRVFLGTTDAGIKYINKTCISGSLVSPYELSLCLRDISNLTYYYNLISNNIKYIHGYEDVLVVATDTGVDVVKLDPQGYRSYMTISGAYKCFMTPEGKFYYTVDHGDTWSIDRVDSYSTDWTLPTHSYITGSGIFESGIILNDVFISDGLYVATSSGVYVIDEDTQEYNLYFTE